MVFLFNLHLFPKVIKKLQAGEEVTIAYLGGSITQGTGADNENCYAALTTKWIENQYPDAKVNYVNAGIGATGSYIGVHRCDAQVLSHDPDLVFIDFSVNDESQNNAINKLTYEGLIRKIWKHSSNPGIICIAMTQDNGTSVQLPAWRQNLRFAAAWERSMEGMYPGFTRPVLFSYRFYNQDLTTGSLLIEIGGHGNNLNEALYAGQLAANGLVQALLGPDA